VKQFKCISELKAEKLATVRKIQETVDVSSILHRPHLLPTMIPLLAVLLSTMIPLLVHLLWAKGNIFIF